jgi:putative transposase
MVHFSGFLAGQPRCNLSPEPAQVLQGERIRRQTYITRDAARHDMFDYIEMFYNPTRKHTNNGILSPVDYKIKQRKMNEAGV